MKYFIIFLLLFGFVYLPFVTQHVSAHGVWSGVSGCPVGACGITDWHLLETASNVMFGVSIVTYAVMLILFVYFLYERKFVLKITRK